MERVKMAVVAAGIWGENHAMAFATYPIVDLVCICDLDGAKAKALAEKLTEPLFSWERRACCLYPFCEPP